MGKQKVRAPQRHFDDLDDEFTSRLRHGSGSKASAVPFPCPPCAIRFVMFIFSGQENGDQDLLYRSLDGDDGNDTEDGM
jgi:hypothetical protein